MDSSHLRFIINLLLHPNVVSSVLGSIVVGIFIILAAYISKKSSDRRS